MIHWMKYYFNLSNEAVHEIKSLCEVALNAAAAFIMLIGLWLMLFLFFQIGYQEGLRTPINNNNQALEIPHGEDSQ